MDRYPDARRPDRRILLRFPITEAPAEHDVNLLSELHSIIGIRNRHEIAAAFKRPWMQRLIVFEEDHFDYHGANSSIHPCLRARRSYAGGVESHEFESGEEPRVLTGISAECERGECAHCPGFIAADTGPMFCIHDCHSAPID